MYSHRKPGTPIPSDWTVEPIQEIQTPETRIGAHSDKPSGYTGNFPTPLMEPTEQERERLEGEEYKTTIDRYVDLVHRISDKFNTINTILAERKKGFFIRLDPVLYPAVSDAVKFYTENSDDDYIDQNIYDKARSDLGDITDIELEKIRVSIRTGAPAGTRADTPIGGAVAVQQQIDKKRKTNVILLAFLALLKYISDWVFALSVIKAAMRFFGASRESRKDMLTNMGIVETRDRAFDSPDESTITRSKTSSTAPEDADIIVSNAQVIVQYVIDIVRGDEVAIESSIPDPNAFLIDEILLPMRKQFTDVVELSQPFVDDLDVRGIGRGSTSYIPESIPYPIQPRILSEHIRPILQEDFLNDIDGNLSRIIRILQGWYLDPRTYCCLVNALGGIHTLVPKWLRALQFGLSYGIAEIDLSQQALVGKITNLLNLIVQGILGSIISHLHSFVHGVLSKKEHQLMSSILNSASKFAQCAPLDVLVSEYAVYFNNLLARLDTYLNSLTSKLMISSSYYEGAISNIERRQKLVKLLNLIDLFIDAWESTYVCSQQGTISINGREVGAGADDGATGIGGATIDQLALTNPDLQRAIQGGEFKPPVSKEEMLTFLKTKLTLPDTDIAAINAIYNDKALLLSCASGTSSAMLDVIRRQL